MEKFCLKNRIFCEIALKIEIFRKFAWKDQIFCVKLNEKVEIFRKFTLRNRIFFTRIHDPPNFKPD